MVKKVKKTICVYSFLVNIVQVLWTKNRDQLWKPFQAVNIVYRENNIL